MLQVARVYSGPQSAEIVGHIKDCNPRGPLLVHIAKLYPKQDCTTFDAFGRVFSGTVKAGDRVSYTHCTAVLGWVALFPASKIGVGDSSGHSHCLHCRLLKKNVQSRQQEANCLFSLADCGIVECVQPCFSGNKSIVKHVLLAICAFS